MLDEWPPINLRMEKRERFIYEYTLEAHMASINISLRKEAYEFLRTLKTGSKSFSDVILELRERRRDRESARSLLRFAGVLNKAGVDWKEKEKRTRAFRDAVSGKVAEVAKDMEAGRKQRK